MRERNDRDADDKQYPAERHQESASNPIGKRSGEKSGDHAAEKNGRNHNGKLPGIQTRSRFKVGKCARDNANVDAVE